MSSSLASVVAWILNGHYGFLVFEVGDFGLIGNEDDLPRLVSLDKPAVAKEVKAVLNRCCKVVGIKRSDAASRKADSHAVQAFFFSLY